MVNAYLVCTLILLFYCLFEIWQVFNCACYPFISRERAKEQKTINNKHQIALHISPSTISSMFSSCFHFSYHSVNQYKTFASDMSLINSPVSVCTSFCIRMNSEFVASFKVVLCCMRPALIKNTCHTRWGAPHLLSTSLYSVNYWTNLPFMKTHRYEAGYGQS